MSVGIDALTGGLLSEGGSRFRFLGIVPSVILFFFLFFIISSWILSPSEVPDFGVVLERIEKMTLQETALLIIAVVLFSLLMEPLQLSLIRILEGYWGKSALGRVMAEIGIDIQIVNFNAQRGSSQKESNTENNIFSIYPKRLNRFLPTMLGNILRAAEDRAGRKYGINAIVFGQDCIHCCRIISKAL